MTKLTTWIIRYEDGMQQEVDAFDAVEAAAMATHGARVADVEQARGRGLAPWSAERCAARLQRAQRIRKAREQAMRDLGLVKVRGAVSGRTYWE